MKPYIQEENTNLHVNEAIAPYITKPKEQHKITWLILKNKDFLVTEPNGYLEFYLEQDGQVPKQSAMQLAEVMEVPLKDIASLLNISYKTFSRIKPYESLDRLASSIILEVADVMAKGIQTFSSREKFSAWLQKPNRALMGKKPFELLHTPSGIKLIHNILVRIEEGIYT